jgi:UDP-2-acetamido-2,6-beta-L-arabino-hexul-4-ose reductase
VTRIGITGIDGFVGFHLRANLHARGLRVAGADLPEFQADARLHQFVGQCDAIVHLAGMNRGNDEDIWRVNTQLVRQLTDAMDRQGVRPAVVFSSSTHIHLDTVYGKAKRECTRLFEAWSAATGARFVNLIIPNVFGEFCRPFYNSVVATFCHQLAHGEQPKVIEDREIELIHAQELADRIYAAVTGETRGPLPLSGRKIKVTELLAALEGFSATYRQGVLPDLGEAFTLNLFNTLRSYWFPGRYPVPLDVHADARGSLFECVKSLGKGQVNYSTTHPEVTRGNHFHRRLVERFLVLEGRARIRIRRLFGDQTVEFDVSGDSPCFVDIPTFHTHNITNTGQDRLLTLFWMNKLFDPGDADTFPEQV